MELNPNPNRDSSHVPSLSALPPGVTPVPISPDHDLSNSIALAFHSPGAPREHASVRLWGLATISRGGFVGQLLGAADLSTAGVPPTVLGELGMTTLLIDPGEPADPHAPGPEVGPAAPSGPVSLS
jgi:hypothetical protein